MQRPITAKAQKSHQPAAATAPDNRKKADKTATATATTAND